MNLILFQENELLEPLTRSDRRFRHIRRVLKAEPGQQFTAGILNGKIGHIEIGDVTPERITFKFRATDEPLPLNPIHLICGLPRPQQVKRIVRDCTSMGVCRIDFFPTENGEKSYYHSPVWTDNAIESLIIEGLEQSRTTLKPIIKRYDSFQTLIDTLPENHKGIVLNNTSGLPTLSQKLQDTVSPGNVRICVGSERGWTIDELSQFTHHGFSFAEFGQRVLRTDTACISAVAVAMTAING